MKTKRKCGVKHANGSSGCKFMIYFLMYQIFWKVFLMMHSLVIIKIMVNFAA